MLRVELKKQLELFGMPFLETPILTVQHYAGRDRVDGMGCVPSWQPFPDGGYSVGLAALGKPFLRYMPQSDLCWFIVFVLDVSC